MVLKAPTLSAIVQAWHILLMISEALVKERATVTFNLHKVQRHSSSSKGWRSACTWSSTEKAARGVLKSTGFEVTLSSSGFEA